MTGVVTIAQQANVNQAADPSMAENGTLFVRDDESTYPPEFKFVVTNVMPEVPVYYDRKDCRWWSPIVHPDVPDIYVRDDIGNIDDVQLYWQPIEFRKAGILFIPAENSQ